MGETYYEVLEVESDATRAEITAAYRKRVLETHPDHNDAPDAATQFSRVSRARSVLTDGDERARYDRLGHDAYERLGRYSSDSSETGDSRTSRQPKTTDSTEKTTKSNGARGTRGASDGTRSRTGSTHGSGTTSQRKAGSQRARRRTKRRGQFTRDATEVGAAGRPPPENEATERSAGGFRYTVHDWDGEATLEWEGRPIDRATALTMAGCWLLYPLFVASSVTSMFPLAVNAVLAVCTGILVAYLLTRPRLATVLFGSWTLLFPFGLLQLPGVSVISVTGLIALGSVWIPFGYALAFWWALRP
ncbi:DnaJ domain-containing protein [Natronorubrum sediminis]|uniref:DnaJ domain-containing protein n=1 Tax=Natronorubrum sediminis TaxID=640943 RepID=A0A1H6FKC6_9EURY|nr:DnaJ domain-containing protein [Natronorubrum sediminis]SEH10842.1 DnaJ domain-containing protein [Natronorubrum sediminis]